MPYSKRYTKSRNPKKVGKKTYNKVKKVMARQKKAKAVKNMDTKFVKIVWDGILYPQQGVTVSNYIAGFAPILAQTQAEEGEGAVTQQPAFILHQTMYDKVRINSVKVTIVPKANVLDQANAQTEDIVTAEGDGRLHWVIDRDGVAPLDVLNPVTAFEQYPSYKNMSGFKKTSRTYSVRYPTGVWLDTGDIWEDATLLKRLGLFGGHSMYAYGIPEDPLEILNEAWASWKVEYNCVFQGTKPVNQSVSNGVITITPIEPDISNIRPMLTNPTKTPRNTVDVV